MTAAGRPLLLVRDRGSYRLPRFWRRGFAQDNPPRARWAEVPPLLQFQGDVAIACLSAWNGV